MSLLYASNVVLVAVGVLNNDSSDNITFNKNINTVVNKERFHGRFTNVAPTNILYVLFAIMEIFIHHQKW